MEQLKETKTKTQKVKTETKPNLWTRVIAIFVAFAVASFPYVYIPLSREPANHLIFGYDNWRYFWLMIGLPLMCLVFAISLKCKEYFPNSQFNNTFSKYLLLSFSITSLFHVTQAFVPRSYLGGDFPRWSYYLVLLVTGAILYQGLVLSIQLYKTYVWGRRVRLEKFLLLDTWGKNGILRKILRKTPEIVAEKNEVTKKELEQDLVRWGLKMKDLVGDNK